jgi:hypothetical protein
VSPRELGTGVWGVVCAEIDEFSTFSCFWAKLAIVDRVSKAVVAVEGEDGFETVAEGVIDEKAEKFCEISVVEPIFAFFLSSGSTRDCDTAMRVGEQNLRL